MGLHQELAFIKSWWLLRRIFLGSLCQALQCRATFSNATSSITVTKEALCSHCPEAASMSLDLEASRVDHPILETWGVVTRICIVFYQCQLWFWKGRINTELNCNMFFLFQGCPFKRGNVKLPFSRHHKGMFGRMRENNNWNMSSLVSINARSHFECWEEE